MDKFQRNYVLTVQTNNSLSFGGQNLVVRPPFTLEFDIVRNTLSSANNITIRVYNLSEKSRNEILRDQYDTNNVKKVSLNAGYGLGETFPLIFTGYVTKCTSYREGNNFITQIEAFDGGNAYVNATVPEELAQFPAGTNVIDVISQLIDSLRPFGVERGLVGFFPEVFSKGYACSGNTLDRLEELTGGAFYIDNGKAYALNGTEVPASPETPVINSASGLLGTPKREQTFLTFDILFEPNVYIGQLVLLESETAPQYNQKYKIVSIHHKAMISDAVCGDAITTLGMYYREQFTPVEFSTSA